MEPQDNDKLTVTKAISAHEEAEAALADMVRNFPEHRCAEMIARVQQNLSELRGMAAAPADP
ncbi:MAG: hypothetical protein JO040_00270 [Gemmatimonadetes bacterium]|nr:hypothetical protein [Gemmatimonadota bacterium]